MDTNALLELLRALITEKYIDVKAAFWSGSVARGEGNNGSDLDLVLVYEELPNAFREAYIFQDWPIDAFIHSPATLKYFFDQEQNDNGNPALLKMVIDSIQVIPSNEFSHEMLKMAQNIYDEGPCEWTKDVLEREQFLITDLLDDIKHPANKEEQIASATRLYNSLANFYFRAQRQWSATGKHIVRRLKEKSPQLGAKYIDAFNKVFLNGESGNLCSLVEELLEPHSGLLWAGFRSDAPKNFRK